MKLRAWHIEQVKNGTAVFKNDGTVEQLEEVLEAILDKKISLVGCNDYYFIKQNKRSGWGCSSYTYKKVISIKSLFNDTLKVGDKVTIAEFEFEVVKTTKSYYLKDLNNSFFDRIFKVYNINPLKLQKTNLNYRMGGAFPECKSLEDLTKFVNAIKKEIKMKDKKIIGYIAPYDINSSVPSGSIYVEEKIYKNESKYVVSGKRGYGSQYYLPAQIVETWEPVYEEGFKVGDFVYCINRKQADHREKKHSPVFKIEEISYQEENIWLRPVKGEGTGVLLTKDVRLATPEEIKAAQTKTFNMNGFEVTVENGKCYHKIDDITSFVNGLFGTIKCGKYNFTLREAIFSSTGCQNSESNLSEWREVYNFMNK